MKNCLLAVICLLLTCMANAQTVLYVSPSGSASNPGTSISAPTTLVNAIATIGAGGTIYLRGGTYSISASVVIPDTNNGTSSARKSIVAYSGEVPVLDFSAMATADANRGLVLDGDYWNITGITISGAGDNGMLLSGNNNTITNCIFKKNKDTGLQLSRYKTSNTTLSSWPSNNLIVNCEAFDNQDPGNENADGFAAKLTCGTGNIFRNCISHHNIDDGWDFYAKDETGPIGPVTLEGCIAYSNGALSTGSTSGSGDKNGFKLGGSGIAVNHIVRRCIAFGNGHHGFTDNDNPGNIEVTNNTSYNNAESNFNFRTGATATFRNNISLSAGSSDKSNGTEIGSTNVWWKNNVSTNSGGKVISAADFLSVSGTVTRASDGTPQLGNLFALASGSDMIDAGVTSTGITYSGSAPDLGARESSGGTTTSYTLTTTATPSAGGSVSRSPNSSSYTAGTVVTLTATPASGYTFTGWTGSTTSSNATITVTMDANKSLTANFTTSTGTTYTLTTNVTPSGGGTVSRSPNASSYAAGTAVTLTATPASGYTFSGWSGGASGSSATTTVTINANTTVTAAFNTSGSSTTLRIDDAASASGGYCSADGSRQNSYTGAYGGYYINLSNSASKGVNYAVNVSAAGTYTLKWGYSNGGNTVSTTARVLVNGAVAVSNVQFPKTISWTTWSTTGTVNVTLAAGNNTIRLETTESTEFAIIDWMEVTGAGVAAGSCGSSLAKLSTDAVSGINATIYPNPAASNATLNYTNPKLGLVWVGIYGTNGVLIRTVQNKVMPAGQHQLPLPAASLHAGSYVVRLLMHQQTESVRLIKQ
ncbi:right-handed parallel beta-helix repeat-containing protein [Chitinophaga sp. sic0106]|uniref:InlB B-repeat-containing protein n=1 Tax=Chitinophaga sp. sic0106 TaxID=2854785 RepID=UPI001C47DDE4|nr:right-handed parallel beta-helix repeat-containing protein [Chitinophaga sp. sic0106]MBV7529760.1 right-handed parallel beta-helix repeat-containing protein [Chitinophaga sp. sic0106]